MHNQIGEILVGLLTRIQWNFTMGESRNSPIDSITISEKLVEQVLPDHKVT